MNNQNGSKQCLVPRVSQSLLSKTRIKQSKIHQNPIGFSGGFSGGLMTSHHISPKSWAGHLFRLQCAEPSRYQHRWPMRVELIREAGEQTPCENDQHVQGRQGQPSQHPCQPFPNGIDIQWIKMYWVLVLESTRKEETTWSQTSTVMAWHRLRCSKEKL